MITLIFQCCSIFFYATIKAAALSKQKTWYAIKISIIVHVHKGLNSSCEFFHSDLSSCPSWWSCHFISQRDLQVGAGQGLAEADQSSQELQWPRVQFGASPAGELLPAFLQFLPYSCPWKCILVEVIHWEAEIQQGQKRLSLSSCAWSVTKQLAPNLREKPISRCLSPSHRFRMTLPMYWGAQQRVSCPLCCVVML